MQSARRLLLPSYWWSDDNREARWRAERASRRGVVANHPWKSPTVASSLPLGGAILSSKASHSQLNGSWKRLGG